MLEIPESQTLARQLGEQAVGKTIKKVEAAHSPHKFAFYLGDPKRDYPVLLEGKTIEKAVAFGGLVELWAGDSRLTFGDGVNLRWIAPGEKTPERHQLLLTLEEGGALVCTVQMYAGISAFRENTNKNSYYLVAKEKRSPLEKEFDEKYFEQLMGSVKQTIGAKAFLATEQRIPGLGNGCLQDILFFAGVHPKTKLQALSQLEKQRLFTSVKTTLADMTRCGGRDTEKDLYGKPGGYPTRLSAKTAKYACPACGGAIVRQAYLGGNVYFCPTCQPEKK